MLPLLVITRKLKGVVLALAAMALSMCLFAGEAMAQKGGGSGPAPIVITSSQALNFGQITFNVGQSGTVTISSAGVRSATGGVILMGGTPTAAAFTVTGERRTPYTITLPTGVSLSNGSMTIPLVIETQHVLGNSLSRTLPNNGRDDFTVGGRITIAGNQQGGNYSGTVLMTVDY